MFLLTTTKMSEYSSHFGCIKSSVLTGLQQMYIDGYFPGLGIGIKVSDVSVGLSVIHSNEGCCWRQAEKTHLKIFSYVFN